ncbi:MAG: hypothetical protein K9N06_04995 [Candidatus Cloacimonetes bacterium]|nr:hypothetical protein [Candidatus Cloacimonadota bacterium]
MKNMLFLFIVMLVMGLLNGTTIIVDIEGTGDYNTIQAGINASTDGDTVLVYPGRYYENIDFVGTTITVGSLEMTTGNRDYIHSTIIDGNQTGSCVAVHNQEGEGTILRGLTLTNGIGFLEGTRRNGGGIYTSLSTIEITNCIIEFNSAKTGGGIKIEGGQINLAGCTVRDNNASHHGGGISSYNLTNSIEFSAENRCNIYNNFAPRGLDIYNSIANGVCTDVIVDTFTVSEPYGYEFYQGDTNYNQNYDDSVFDMLHAKYERVEADLYVSPEGNDANSGLSAEEPLQTINRALSIITADTENPRTIYLADGVYSTLDNFQLFPVSMRAHVSLVGESRENTIIDLGIGNQGFIVDLFSEMGYEIKNLTIRNGHIDDDDLFFAQGINLRNSFNYIGPVLLENLLITDNDIAQFLIVSNMNITLRDIIFRDNTYSLDDVTCFSSFDYNKRQGADRNVLIENCFVNNNELGVMYLWGSEFVEPENLRIDIVNTEFSENISDTNHTWIFTEGLSIAALGSIDLNVINSTFTENYMYGTSPGKAPIKIFYGVDAELINNIIYNNSDHSVIIDGEAGFETIVTMNHNIIDGGMNGILATGPYTLNWDYETNWDVDPLFMNEGDYPYSLQTGSPAINMGTLDLPEGVVLPEFDLAGNPRVLGNSVDMGAYEYNPFGVIANEDLVVINNDLYVYPNPIVAGQLRNGRAKILWIGEECNDMQFEIFNVKGQRIKQLKMGNGTRTAFWDLTNNTGSMVSSGVCFIRMKAEGEYLAQRKVVLYK